MALASREPAGAITGYHAHVYYDARTKPLAAQLRDALAAGFEVELGRWHDQPIGPHPSASYQIAFRPALFGSLVPLAGAQSPGADGVRPSRDRPCARRP